jgi:hypothetical protein
MYRWLVVGLLSVPAVALEAQDVEDFCIPADCSNLDPECCVADTLELRLISACVADGDPDPCDDGANCVANVFEYETFQAGTMVPVAIVSQTATEQVQGWSYAVKHDSAFLALDELAVTVASSDASRLEQRGFCATQTVEGGWISAFVLSFRNPVQLPVGDRNTLAFACYEIVGDAGAGGTLVEFVSREIGPLGSPPVDLNITVDGKAKLPLQVTNFRVKASGGVVDPEICDNDADDDGDGDVDCDDADCAGDPACPVKTPEVCTGGVDEDGDGDVDCADADCVDDPACVVGDCPDWAFYFGDSATEADLDVGAADEFSIGMRNATESFAFSFGATTATAGGVTTYEFSGALGTDNNRLIELIITDDQGDTREPATPNQATANATPVDIVHGSAIAAFDPGDFLEFNLEPAVGGPGFFVGYVSDLNDDTNKIAASTGDCPALNEVLVVKLTGEVQQRFQRGDADGNGKVNISDVVLIIQIIVGNLQERYNCDDALDANDDGELSIADALPVLSWLFSRGQRLPEPFLQCDTDDTQDDLGCAENDPVCGA